MELGLKEGAITRVMLVSANLPPVGTLPFASPSRIRKFTSTPSRNPQLPSFAFPDRRRVKYAPTPKRLVLRSCDSGEVPDDFLISSPQKEVTKAEEDSANCEGSRLRRQKLKDVSTRCELLLVQRRDSGAHCRGYTGYPQR